MEPIYVFIIRNDVWIYIVSALGLIWFSSELLRAQRSLKRAIFGLERETSQRIRANALGFIFLFATISGFVYFVNAKVASNLPPELFKPPTPTPNIFVTPLSSPTPLGTPEVIRPTSTAPLVPTITLASQENPIPEASSLDSNPLGEAGPTMTPEATITPFVACTLDLNISEPRDGAFVSGAIAFSGTASFENFLWYKLEANGPETNGQWASLLGRSIEQPVREGFLGNVNLTQWQPGPYLIRLTGVNNSGNDIGYCVIQITLNSS